MDPEELRQHIHSASPAGGTHARRLASLILGACWPGGPEDRTNQIAIEWLRHSHLGQTVAELPTCSCSTGRCALCN